MAKSFTHRPVASALLGGTALLLAAQPQAARAQAANAQAHTGCAGSSAVQSLSGPAMHIDSIEHHDAGPAPAMQLPPGVPPLPPEQLPAHCDIVGSLQQRTGIDGQHYAIRFHLRLPDSWNGKLFFQGGGGSDGDLGEAIGRLGGGPNALALGYAVLSQDSGHDNAVNTNPAKGGMTAFGFDPQARRNYGGASLAPAVAAARTIVRTRYGQLPKYSYFVGCSKGGQEGLVLAQRNPALFDGILAMAPGLSLPRAAIAEAWDTQSFAGAAGPGVTPLSLARSFSDGDLALAAKTILAVCDGDDGLVDGMIHAFEQCTSAKVLPQLARITCAGQKTADCLSAAQVEALRRVHDGARDSNGKPVYSGFFWDAGWAAPGWRIWKIGSADGQVPALNLLLGAPSLGAVFSTPPVAVAPGPQAGLDYMLGVDMGRAAAAVDSIGGAFTTSAWQDVSARSPDLAGFFARNGKLIVAQGVSDPVFSIEDTIVWYKLVMAQGGPTATAAMRLFALPGMNHCSGGPATDQFDGFGALVAWVEHGKAPERITAHASPMSPWSKRSRPLCAYPRIARYRGAGDEDDAENFVCT